MLDVPTRDFATPWPRRWFALLACVLLLGQSFVAAHASDVDGHADEVTCDLCTVAAELSGALPAAAPAASLGAAPDAVPRIGETPVATILRRTLPRTRAPPVSESLR